MAENLSNLPQVREMREQIEALKQWKRLISMSSPVLKFLRFDVSKLEGDLSKLPDIEAELDELIITYERFNEIFASKGWIVFDLLKIEVAKAAIQMADSGDMIGAEAILIDYYNPEMVASLLKLMRGIKAFQPRMELAQKALIDYREERYHACVPVVLALLDGMVNELHEQHRGFFADNISLEAWNSISTHNNSLNQLVKLMTKTRQKTRTEEINIPYRNGIMHGTDLGYANKTVAAKTWATLFATRDWALKAEQGLLIAPPSKTNPTWKETLNRIKEGQEEKTRIENWRPRTAQIGIDIPISGESKDFLEGSPEYKLVEFLNYWKARNYGYMAKCIFDYGETKAKLAGDVREQYSTKNLTAFELRNYEDQSPAVTIIQSRLIYQEDSYSVEKVVEFRLLNHSLDGEIRVRGQANTTWGILNWLAVD